MVLSKTSSIGSQGNQLAVGLSHDCIGCLLAVDQSLMHPMKDALLLGDPLNVHLAISGAQYLTTRSTKTSLFGDDLLIRVF